MDYIPVTSQVKIRPTPWDTKALGVDTYEIVLQDLKKSNVHNVENTLDEITSINHPSIFYTRIDANSSLSKLILSNTGFFNCETQLHIVRSNIKNFTTPKELGQRRPVIQHASEQDYSEVTRRSSEVFRYSRFHEDPYVPTNRADLRMEIWTEDMKDQLMPLIVSRNKIGELDSFIFYKNITDRNIELILGGSMPGKGMMTPLFWAAFLEHFKNLGIERIETKISASNIVIFNIYLFFNFQIKTVYFDFHKHARCRFPENL